MQPSTEQQQQIQTRKLVWSVPYYIFLTNFILTHSFSFLHTNTHLKLINFIVYYSHSGDKIINREKKKLDEN